MKAILSNMERMYYLIPLPLIDDFEYDSRYFFSYRLGDVELLLPYDFTCLRVAVAMHPSISTMYDSIVNDIALKTPHLMQNTEALVGTACERALLARMIDTKRVGYGFAHYSFIL